MGIFNFFRKKSASTHSAAPDGNGVDFDEEHVVHRRPDGKVERISWTELTEVGILTTDDGPFEEDVIWMLLDSSRGSGCAIPSGAKGMDRLLKKLQELPDFDNEQVVLAMGSVVDARFVCWRRSRASAVQQVGV
jgi:hypothetical protein